MINEIENKNSQKNMSDLEYAKNDTEMMRYRVNSLSYKLGLGAMGCSLMGAFICLNSLNPNNLQVILIILLNIVILLGGFLCAEKVKNYNKTGAIVQVVFGVICFARVFYVPLILLINFNKYISAYNWLQENLGAKPSEKKAQNAIMNEAKNYLGATITSYYEKNNFANAFLPANGIFRAIVAMIFFVCAGVLFVTAGIIGYQRSKKLSNYLESINVNK